LSCLLKKHYQPFCVRTGGDALMKLPCSGLVLSTEVRYLRTWKKANHLFLFQTNTLDEGQCVYGSTIQNNKAKW